MAETMSHVERVLWRIAELGARCSQRGVAGGREPLWAELEETISALAAECEAVRQDSDIAPEQVRSLEGRLKVALHERDREKVRAKEWFADAEAARRERDRDRAKARKAMAAAVEARDVAREATLRADEALARTATAELAADEAMAARDEALASRDEATAAMENAIATGERAADAYDTAAAARDKAIRTRHTALRALQGAEARIAELESALDVAEASGGEAIATPVEPEAAVVVLPGLSLPEPQEGPANPLGRVSWQPTWSEWANPATVSGTDGATDLVAVTEEDRATDITERSLETSELEGGSVRYLNVAATIAQLLPEELGPLLLTGATVVRREGRLFATVAVRTNQMAIGGTTDLEQADRFTGAGFKVEWTANAPLAV